MRNWKTTVGGIVTALGLFLMSQDNPVMHLIGQILAPAGAFITGLAATDGGKATV